MHSSWYCRSWIFSGALDDGTAMERDFAGDTYRRLSEGELEQAVHLLTSINHPLDAGGMFYYCRSPGYLQTMETLTPYILKEDDDATGSGRVFTLYASLTKNSVRMINIEYHFRLQIRERFRRLVFFFKAQQAEALNEKISNSLKT